MSETTEIESKNLSAEEVRALLVRAVEEKGADYTYDKPRMVGMDGEEYGSCRYFHQDQPSCIVGHALAYVGATPDQIEEDQVASHSATLLTLDLVVLGALVAAQTKQDRGDTWGDALNEFNRYVSAHKEVSL